MQSTSTLGTAQAPVEINLRDTLKALWKATVQITEGASVILFVVLTLLMWADLFTTIVVVSWGGEELNPDAAFVIQRFGFFGLLLFQGLRVCVNFALYLFSGSESPFVALAQKIGDLLSPAVGLFLARTVSVLGWVARLALICVWVSDIWIIQYVLWNPIVGADYIPQAQMTVQILGRLLGYL